MSSKDIIENLDVEYDLGLKEHKRSLFKLTGNTKKVSPKQTALIDSISKIR